MSKQSLYRVIWIDIESTQINFGSSQSLHCVAFEGQDVIQGLGRTKLENSLWIGCQLKAGNGLQRIHTISGVLPGAV